jgi:hypothetical protein
MEQAVRELAGKAYAGCNLLCADGSEAYVLHAGDRLEVRQLSPGVHVLTAQDVDDVKDPRLAYALAWVQDCLPATAQEAVAALADLCSQNGTDAPPMCLRGEIGGTVSSSIIALCTPLGRSLYWHAQGPPDVTPYEDYSHLFGQLDESRHRGD